MGLGSVKGVESPAPLLQISDLSVARSGEIVIQDVDPKSERASL